MKAKHLLIALLFFANYCSAQDQLLQLAKEYFKKQDYVKATELYSTLYQNTPNDNSIYKDYIVCLLETKDFKLADKLIKSKIKKDKENYSYQFDLAALYAAQGDQKKAGKVYDNLSEEHLTSDHEIREIAKEFEKRNLNDYAIAIYENGRKGKNIPFLYAQELAVLYDKKGDFEKATESLLDMAALSYENMDPAKTALLRLFTQADKVESVRKKIIKRINAEPENTIYPDILSWLYIQQKDYESAFVQVKALDIRLKEQGRRPLNFARVASREKEYDAADLAYQYVMDIGKEGQFYAVAWSEKIENAKNKIIDNPLFTPFDVSNTLKQYELFIQENPKYKNAQTIRDYAMLLARYADRVDDAINFLDEAITSNQMNAVLKGNCKLDLGDYYLLKNNNWEATLLYSQVDKEFKNDMLGEEARYRNARLSYFIGDYEWAQGQLDILKASTSELIANDALNLSVLITENIPPDSNLTPLQMFSRAELLIFQNKSNEAVATLDSISKSYPAHPLADDILMKRAFIAASKKDYNTAVDLYSKVAAQYKEDILADDAIYQAAIINDKYLNNKAEAMKWYEKIILEYSNSSFINEARKAFRRLREDKLEVE